MNKDFALITVVLFLMRFVPFIAEATSLTTRNCYFVDNCWELKSSAKTWINSVAMLEVFSFSSVLCKPPASSSETSHSWFHPSKPFPPKVISGLYCFISKAWARDDNDHRPLKTWKGCPNLQSLRSAVPSLIEEDLSGSNKRDSAGCSMVVKI